MAVGMSSAKFGPILMKKLLNLFAICPFLKESFILMTIFRG